MEEAEGGHDEGEVTAADGEAGADGAKDHEEEIEAVDSFTAVLVNK